nr:aminotransferase class I/II-fold pyridoxal phosphate-dependent enzyme [Butyrivibrio sp.]
MGQYDFDSVIDRKNTSSIKWDFGMQRKGRDDLLPLWVADMDFQLPEEVVEDIVKRAQHGVFGYTDPDESYLFSVRDWYKRRHGIEFGNEEITVVPGVVYAIAQAIRALTKEGEAVLIQQPVYYPFSEMITINKRKLVNSPLINKDGRYEMDFEDFERKIEENDVKLFLLCSPHNPVGRVWTGKELEKVADICDRHGVYIFADEIH